jgi:hypothetical protein
MKIQNNNLRSLESLYLPIMWSLILSLLTKKYKLLTKNTRQKEESNEVPYNENIFSCIEYDSEGNEKNKLIRNYSPNGEWETIFYHNGKPSHIVRKECTIVEN